MPEDYLHIPISVLWTYSRYPDVLESAQLDHLRCCEDCVAIVWLGYTSESVTHLKRSLEEYEFGHCVSRLVH